MPISLWVDGAQVEANRTAVLFMVQNLGLSEFNRSAHFAAVPWAFLDINPNPDSGDSPADYNPLLRILVDELLELARPGGGACNVERDGFVVRHVMTVRHGSYRLRRSLAC